MTLYVDTSALLKRYVEEPESEECASYLVEADWVTAAHTEVEVRRNLARLLSGSELRHAQRCFFEDWERIHVVSLDATTCKRAAEVAELTGARSLDALHLAAALRTGSSVTLLTYDLRQAQVARQLGMAVLGT